MCIDVVNILECTLCHKAHFTLPTEQTTFKPCDDRHGPSCRITASTLVPWASFDCVAQLQFECPMQHGNELAQVFASLVMRGRLIATRRFQMLDRLQEEGEQRLDGVGWSMRRWSGGLSEMAPIEVLSLRWLVWKRLLEPLV